MSSYMSATAARRQSVSAPTSRATSLERKQIQQQQQHLLHEAVTAAAANMRKPPPTVVEYYKHRWVIGKVNIMLSCSQKE